MRGSAIAAVFLRNGMVTGSLVARMPAIPDHADATDEQLGWPWPAWPPARWPTGAPSTSTTTSARPVAPSRGPVPVPGIG